MVRGTAYRVKTGLASKWARTKKGELKEWIFPQCAYMEGLDKFILGKRVLRAAMGIQHSRDEKGKEWLVDREGNEVEIVHARGFDAVEWARADGGEERTRLANMERNMKEIYGRAVYTVYDNDE